MNGAQTFLLVHGDQRWFLYLHMMDLQEYLYDEDSARFGTAYTDVYDNSILRTNQVLEVLYGLLASTGQLERTIIVIASDHGEAFGEHGSEGHARDLFVESTHVPWIISLPFRFAEPVVIFERTENVDVWPTLYALLGLPPDDDVDGVSALPLIEAALEGRRAPPQHRVRFSYLDQTWGRLQTPPRPLVVVDDGALRLHHHLTAPATDRLYDARADRKEEKNLRAARAEDAERLAATARSHLEQTPRWQAPDQPELSEMELNNLRALGYDVR